MVETRSQETLRHAVTPAAKMCALLIRLDDLSDGQLDNTKHWEVVSLLFQDMATGINSLARATQTFEGVVKDYEVPVTQVTRAGEIMQFPRRWQRANTVLFVSDYFAEAQPETNKLLSILLIAKGRENGLSLSGLNRGWGKKGTEYAGIHAEQYKKLAEEVLEECGIGGSESVLRGASLEQVIEGYLVSSLRQKVAA